MTKVMDKYTQLDDRELMNVNGGNWFTDAWDGVCNWCEENTDVLIRVGCVAGGIALCATGIGAAAGAGLIAVESVGAAAIVSTGVGSIGGTVVGVIVTDGEE